MGVMTTNGELLTRVRTAIHEPSTVAYPRRTDTEILQWLQDGQLDYMHRVPQEHFPELTSSQTFSGSSVGLPAGYLFFHSCTVSHTLSGTVTGVDECFILGPGDTYLQNNYPGYLGAWAQITGNTLSCGPNVYSGTLTYVGIPSTISSTSGTFDPGAEHEAAIVNYAASMALLVVNDAGSDQFMNLYLSAVQAKGGRGESKDIERA
jgi:hypothetical protein